MQALKRRERRAPRLRVLPGSLKPFAMRILRSQKELAIESDNVES